MVDTTMSDTLTVRIRANGDMRFIWSDELAPLADSGVATTRRVSNVEQAGPGQGWTADMSPVDGPELGPFRLRRDALSAEQAWLNDHGILEQETAR